MFNMMRTSSRRITMLPSIAPVKFLCCISCYSVVFALLLLPFTRSWTPTVLPSTAGRSRLSLRLHPNTREAMLCTRQSIALYSTPNRRKRRRRKDPSDDSIEEDSDEGMNELPDFDLQDDGMSTTNQRSGTTTASSSSPASPMAADPLLGPISSNMMATPSSSNRSPSSVNDLLRDRSLEQKLERLYDEGGKEDEEALPDLLSLQKKQSSPPETSASSLSKRERQILARQQQDEEQQKLLQNAQKEEDFGALFSKLPFITNEQGKVTPIKILETATWACIIALILWELYINSPFFTRAAPIIPVVYDLWM